MQPSRRFGPMLFRAREVRKALAREPATLLLVPLVVLLAAVRVPPDSDAAFADSPAISAEAMLAAQALAGEFFVLGTALPWTVGYSSHPLDCVPTGW